jgi:hypothetical protein
VAPVIAAVLLLIFCGLVAYGLWLHSEPPASPGVDPETALRAATDLHRIRRRLDVAGLRHEQRVSSNRARQAIAEALESDDDAS